MDTISQNDYFKMLDTDFDFYTSFSKDYRSKMKNCHEVNLCEAWIKKLCSESARTIEEKKCRNLWLCNLVACIQRGYLTKEFLYPPKEGRLSTFPQYVSKVVKTPEWVDDILNDNSVNISKDGRTYLATKKLENDCGALAYLAITLGKEEPEWSPQTEKHMNDETCKDCINSLSDVPQKELASVLASRKTFKERKTAIDYYNNLLQKIRGQLDSSIEEGSDDTINDLIVRLVLELKKANKYSSFSQFEYRERYFRLLEVLAKNIKKTLDRIERREIVLDELEKQVICDTFLDKTIEDTIENCECADWRSYVSSEVSEERSKNIEYVYPPELINDFLILLEKEKLSLGNRIRHNYLDMVKQMNEDFKREQRAGQARCDAERSALEEVEAALEVCENEPPVQSPAARNLKINLALSEALLERLQEENLQLMKIVKKLSSFSSTADSC